MAQLDCSNSTSDRSPSPVRVKRRPTRSKKLPAKFRQLQDDQEDEIFTFEEVELEQSRNVVVKCAQQGKRFSVKVKDLTSEDFEPLRRSDLKAGASLMADFKGKTYPVIFEAFADEDQSGVKKNAQKSIRKPSHGSTYVEDDSEDEKGEQTVKPKIKKTAIARQDFIDKKQLLLKAKEDKENHDPRQPPKKKQRVFCDDNDAVIIGKGEEERDSDLKELIIRMENRMERMEKRQEHMDKKLDKLLAQLKTVEGGHGVAVKKEEQDETFVFNGVNLLRIHSTGPYAYATKLLDTLFTRAEQHPCLLFKSSKSEKPELDRARVEKLLACLDRRYGKEEWDMKTLIEKLNQKCRDALKNKKVHTDTH